MSKTETFTLADQSFTVQPMKLGLLRKIWDIIDAADTVHPFERAAAIIKAGLATDYPNLDVDALLDSGIGIKDLYGASNAVLTVAGLVEAKPVAVAPLGEAQAGATASTGA